jgi:PAS domain S-box-containing protein
MVIFYPTLKLANPFLLVIIACLLISNMASAADGQRQVIVGTWDNPPLVFRDAAGQDTGLAVDILQQVASENNWKLVFHHAKWAQNLDALQNGDIDLLAVIAYTPKRTELYDYPQQTLINNWGVIYQTPNNNITSMRDLQDKRVALVPKIIHSKVFTNLMQQFDFPFEIVPAKNFEDVLRLLNDNEADAGVINRVISIMQADKYQVKPTSIIFNPVQVRYATLKGKNQDLIQALDNYLAKAKANKDSAYYHSINKWLKNQGEKPDYSWIIALLGMVGMLFALISIYIYLVKREVKRRTAALTESENRFRQLADNINAVFYVVSADWQNTVYVSPGYQKIWGLPMAALYKNPTSWLNIVDAEDRDRVRAEITTNPPVENEQPNFSEYRIQRPDGKEYWISTRVYPVYDKNGYLYRLAGISADITARKQAELELARSKAEFETIFNAISDVVLYSDTDRRLIHVNPATTKTFGYSNEEILGKDTKIFYTDTTDYERQGQRQFNKTSDIKSASYEMRYQRKDGSTFIGETFGAKVFDNNGDVIGFIGVIRDITQRKQDEAELLQHRDHLEELVLERTAELSNLNQELEAFSYSVSHDLRAPLRAINGFSSLLCHDFADKLDAEALDYLGRIQKASIKMGDLIDDLINISRVSRVDLIKETIDLSSMAEEILAAHQNAEPERHIHWQVEKGLSTKADRTLIQVLLQNLLGNAWKYTAKNSDAEIRFFRATIADEEDAFCIEDNGTGFNPQYKDKIFEPFERLHSNKEFDGTGIGLATVHRVIKRHGGQIWAESTPGKGSRFYLPQ